MQCLRAPCPPTKYHLGTRSHTTSMVNGHAQANLQASTHHFSITGLLLPPDFQEHTEVCLTSTPEKHLVKDIACPWVQAAHTRETAADCLLTLQNSGLLLRPSHPIPMHSHLADILDVEKTQPPRTLGTVLDIISEIPAGNDTGCCEGHNRTLHVRCSLLCQQGCSPAVRISCLLPHDVADNRSAKGSLLCCCAFTCCNC